MIVLEFGEQSGAAGKRHPIQHPDQRADDPWVELLADFSTHLVELAFSADGRRVEALVFLSDIRHPQWAGALSLDRQAELIAGSRGLSGRNVDYLRDLVEHLETITRRLGMAPTGGSDYHGAHRPGIALGKGSGDLLVPDSTLAELRLRAGI